MRRFAVVVLAVALTFVAWGPTIAQERGLAAFKATIVVVRDKSLDLATPDPNGSYVPQKRVRFDVGPNTRFEEVHFEVIGGKVQANRKTIALSDLAPMQSIHVISYSLGDQRTILTGVVAKADALKRIAALRGSVRPIPLPNGDIQHDVDLSGSNVADDDMLVIASMDDLVNLRLSNTKITDKGIAHLANHPKLLTLEITGTRTTNAALAHLATIPRLYQVSVDNTAITREAIVRFASERRLEGFCQISTGRTQENRVFEVMRPGGGATLPHVYLMKKGTYYARFYADDATRRKATTYYHRDGPVGAVMRRFAWFSPDDPHDPRGDARLPASLVGLSALAPGGMPTNALACLWSEPAIGVVELNGGTIAAYGRAFQTIDFFNADPDMVQFCVKTDGKAPPFGFVEDARSRGSNVRVIEGAYKNTVRKGAPRGFYSALFVEITVEQPRDPRPLTKADVHFDLMTQEALQDLMEKTVPDGVVCFHTSHRTHEFTKPLAGAARALGFAAKVVSDQFQSWDKAGNPDDSHFGSEWLVIARSPEHLARFHSEKSRTRALGWRVVAGDEAWSWRDGLTPKMPVRQQ